MIKYKSDTLASKERLELIDKFTVNNSVLQRRATIQSKPKNQ